MLSSLFGSLVINNLGLSKRDIISILQEKATFVMPGLSKREGRRHGVSEERNAAGRRRRLWFSLSGQVSIYWFEILSFYLLIQDVSNEISLGLTIIWSDTSLSGQVYIYCFLNEFFLVTIWPPFRKMENVDVECYGVPLDQSNSKVCFTFCFGWCHLSGSVVMSNNQVCMKLCLCLCQISRSYSYPSMITLYWRLF